VTGASAVALGIALGVRHATDVDHLAALSTLLHRECGPGRAARVAALWGAGHTASFLGVALPVVLAGVRVPVAFERAGEALVALMLVALGGWHLARAGRPVVAAGADVAGAARPVAVGVVHGLAGSAGVALLAATTIRSRLWASVYLALFGLGTVLGMVGLTVALAWPLGWAARRPDGGRVGVTRAAALSSLALGAVLFWRAVASEP
jgi:hypothetical protein